MAILSNINGKFAVEDTGAIRFSDQTGTTGQILKSNGNAAPTWIPQSDIVGAYLPLAGGTLTGATATATGISFTVGGALSGTTATFAGDVLVEDNLYLTDAGTVRGKIQLNASDRDDLDIKVVSLGSNMKFFTVDTERMRITSAGNVNIATPITNAFYGLSLQYNATDTADFKVNQATGQIKIGGVATGYFPTFYSAGSEKMRITTGGNVGIGTASPGAKLQIGSATHAPNGNLSNNLLQIKSPSSWAYLTIGNGDTANSTAYIGGASGFLVLGSVTDAGALSEHIRVQSSGNVGIGTASPTARLKVIGVNDTWTCQIENTQALPYGLSVNTAGTAGTTFNSAFYTHSGTGMFIVNNGKVGIGTASPFTNLEVAGSGADSIIRLYAAGGTANIRTWEIRAVGVAGEGLLFRQVNDANNSYTNRMIIDTDGDVGIGTITPSTKLDVNGQMTHDGLVMKSGDGVYVDRYLVYTLNISLIASTWVDTGIYSNSGSYQLGASGTYAVQIYSDSHAGEPYWYSAYWSGIMSWQQGSVNQNAVFEIPLTQAAHSTNNRPLELRIQNTLGSGPGTPTNNARLEVKTTAAGTNTVSLSFRFRRLI